MSFRDQAKHAAERADALEAENAKLRAEVERLKQRIADLSDQSYSVQIAPTTGWTPPPWEAE